MKLHYSYDQDADILYLSRGKPSKDDETRETADDLVLRMDPKRNTVRGVTILNFTKRLRRKGQAVELPVDVTLRLDRSPTV